MTKSNSESILKTRNTIKQNIESRNSIKQNIESTMRRSSAREDWLKKDKI